MPDRHFTLEMRVVYEAEATRNVDMSEVDTVATRNLDRIAAHAAANGLMSGDTPLLVDHWHCAVETSRTQGRPCAAMRLHVAYDACGADSSEVPWMAERQLHDIAERAIAQGMLACDSTLQAASWQVSVRETTVA